MDVTAGTRLGPYEIVAPLGAGGMGCVYRARDTRLKREVALKVISERMQPHPDLRERFQREATAVAALNHPNICQVYDVGAEHGVDFIVMELIDGETLTARLSRGPLPIAEAVRVARELTAAVGAAHRAGVIHRDIKPSNIMLTRSGLKLLDFGLARQQRTPAPAGSHSTQAPLTEPLTLTGMVLGTWQYMSPEQLRGAEVDARGDVFSIGVVLYETFTGKRLFQRPTHEASLIAILEDEPASMSAIRSDVPANIDRVVRVCLAKNPADRWQSAHDLHHALEANVEVLSAAVRVFSSRAATIVAAAAIIIAVMGVALWPRAAVTVDPGRTIRSVIDVSPLEMWRDFADLQFLPDGGAFIFSGIDGERRTQLYRYDLATASMTPIAGTTECGFPFLSPDNRWIGCRVRGEMVKVPREGGQAVRIASQNTGFGASWGDDGFIVYGSLPGSGLFRVPESGGTPTSVTVLTDADQGNDHRYPQILPGNRRILFSVGTGPEDSARIVGQDLISGERKDVIHGAMSFRYLTSGHIAYVSNDALFVVAFDSSRLEVTGTPVKIADRVENTEGSPQFTFSPNGDVIYLPGGSIGPQHRVLLVSLDGAVEPLPNVIGQFTFPRFSPDGTKVLLMRGATKNNLWVYDLVRTTLTRVSYGRYQGSIWTRDGRITTPRGGPGDQRIVIRAADGTGDDSAPLTDGGADERPVDWTPDGQTLLYNRAGGQLWSVTPGRAKPAPLQAVPFNRVAPRLSPDGRLLTYAANDTGRNQIYVSSLSGDGGRVQISVHGGFSSVWSPDGRRVYFRGPTGDPNGGVGMLSSDITTSPQLSASKPRLLFPNDGYTDRFDLSPDGKRFVMISQDSRPPSHTLRLVQNWRALLPATSRD